MRRTPASSCFSEMFRKFWNSLSAEVQSSHRFPWFTVKVTSHPVPLFWYFFWLTVAEFYTWTRCFYVDLNISFFDGFEDIVEACGSSYRTKRGENCCIASFPVVLASFLIRSSFLEIWGKLRILTGKKHLLKLNSRAYEKYEFGHLGRWYIKLTLFKRF